MVGSGLLFTPWAYQGAGLLLGIILTIVAFVISFSTQYFVMVTAGADLDYTQTLQKTFGRNGWRAGMTIFIIYFFLPLIVYFQLLSQLLYPVLYDFGKLIMSDIATFNDDKSMIFSNFSYTYTVFIVFTMLWVVALKKDLSVFVRLNTLGVLFTMIIICFIVGIGIVSLTDTKVHYEIVSSGAQTSKNDDGTWSVQLPLVGEDYTNILGILASGYYLHNVSLPIY